jgi:hypothetical protein
VVVVQFAELLRGSPYAAETSLNDLRIRANHLSAQLPNDPDMAEFAGLVSQAMQITEW